LGVADLLTADEDAEAACFDALAAVVLGVEGDDAAGSDEYVVDVGATVADWDGVEGAPPERSRYPQVRPTLRSPLAPVRHDRSWVCGCRPGGRSAATRWSVRVLGEG